MKLKFKSDMILLHGGTAQHVSLETNCRPADCFGSNFSTYDKFSGSQNSVMVNMSVFGIEI
jgi:hypothetical protein